MISSPIVLFSLMTKILFLISAYNSFQTLHLAFWIFNFLQKVILLAAKKRCLFFQNGCKIFLCFSERESNRERYVRFVINLRSLTSFSRSAFIFVLVVPCSSLPRSSTKLEGVLRALYDLRGSICNVVSYNGDAVCFCSSDTAHHRKAA